MKRFRFLVLFLLLASLSLSGIVASASPMPSDAPTASVAIDLSGASSGQLIVAPGGSFAQSFVGQTVSGTTLIGSPTPPLTLQPSGQLTVAFFNDFNTILPQPNNQAPLCIKLDLPATSISWVMGHADEGVSLTLDFFLGATQVHTAQQPLSIGYNPYSASSPIPFNGMCIYNNTDPAGLRFYNFVYETPCPVTLTLQDEAVFADATAAPSALDIALTLYDLRDGLMSDTPAGRYYRDLFEANSARITRLLISDAELRAEFGQLLKQATPGFEKLVAGAGNEAVISKELVARTLVFAERLAAADQANGDGALAKVIRSELSRLDLQRLSGMTFAEGWNYSTVTRAPVQ